MHPATSAPEIAIDAAGRAAVIDGILTSLRTKYVFPDVAGQMEEAVRGRAGSGDYDALTTVAALCEALTAHLQDVSHDKHLRVFCTPDPWLDDEHEQTPEQREEARLHCVLSNFGFEKVERLAGNIGYLELRGFFPTEIDGAGEAAVAAMTVLAHTSALIIDLRRNGGGSPSMVALVSSYLFTEPTHLNSLYWRERERTEQFWTLPYVPGRRDGTRPVYVLTSARTFSGAEEFAYNLKQLKRATLVGETTGGGAHPGGPHPITEHVRLWIPMGRAINPITGTNWEGTGVVPDIAVPASDALRVAHVQAAKQVLERLGDSPRGPFNAVAEEARNALAELGA